MQDQDTKPLTDLTYHFTVRENEEGEMEKAKKLCIPVLLGVLLIALMVGVAGAGENNRTSAALGPTAYITIPAGAFSPNYEEAEWYNGGAWIRNDSVDQPEFFLAGPIVFPYAGTVKVTKLALVAHDNNPDREVCADLKRVAFLTGVEASMVGFCSNGSATGVRKFTSASISPDTVNPQWAGCYAQLLLEPGTELEVYAVRISYRPVL
jgi:hypothetical protein